MLLTIGNVSEMIYLVCGRSKVFKYRSCWRHIVLLSLEISFFTVSKTATSLLLVGILSSHNPLKFSQSLT